MKLTTKTPYALAILRELRDTELLSLDKIAERISAPESYLQRITARLKKAKMIEPKLGAFGGYRLSCAADKTTAIKVAEAVGDRVSDLPTGLFLVLNNLTVDKL